MKAGKVDRSKKARCTNTKRWYSKGSNSYQKGNVPLIIIVILTILIVGGLGYYLSGKKIDITGRNAQENQQNQVNESNISTTSRFLYVVNEQRRKNDDSRNWVTDYYTVISYDPLLDKKNIIYETSSEQLFKESGDKQTCCVAPQIRRYGENKLAIFGPKGFQAKVIDINGNSEDTFVKNNTIFAVTTDGNYIAYNSFNEDNDTNFKVRNLITNEEKMTTLDDVFKGKERNTNGLYLAPSSKWEGHTILFSIHDSYLPHGPKRDYWDKLGRDAIFQYDADSGNIKQMSTNDPTVKEKITDLSRGFQFGERFENGKWIAETLVYGTPCTPQYLRIVNRDSNTTKNLGVSISLCADEKEVKRTAGTIMSFSIIGWMTDNK